MLTFVLIVSGVRGRRATGNVAAAGLLVTLAAIGLVGWARWGKPAPYLATYQWINIPVSFAGASQFQGFGIDISLRIDHVALAAAAALTLATLGVVAWHRFGGRAEAGPARFHAELLLALTGLLGVVISGDLAALAAWWGVAGAATYLLLAHRWGTEATARAARIGLWLPAAGDLALVCAVAVVYSRFGQLDVDRLVAPGLLQSTYQAGLKSIGLAALLFGVAALIRAGAFPFTAWQMGLEAPPGVAAWVQGAWPLAALVMLVRVLFLFDAAGPEPYRVFAYLCAASAAAAILLALGLNDLRRSVAWAGAAVSALLLLGLGQPGALATSVAAALAACLARPAVTVASWAVAVAMRSLNLLDMGETWTRMRWTTAGYLAGSVVLALALVPKTAARSAAGWGGTWFLGACLLVLAAALLRPVGAAGFGALRRRRAFEPTRVREVLGGAWASALALALAGAVALVLAFLTGWVAWLGGRGHAAGVEHLFAWLAVAAAACVVGGLAGGRLRDRVVGLSAWTQAVAVGYAGLALVAVDRFLLRPAVGVTGGFEGGVVERGSAALDEAATEVGALAAGRGRRLGGSALGLAVLAVAAVAAAALLAGGGR